MRKDSRALRTSLKRISAGGVALALVALFGLHTAAFAAGPTTVFVDTNVPAPGENTLRVEAAAAQVNVITIAGSTTLTIKDTGSHVVTRNATATTAGCVATSNPNQVNCPIGGITQIIVNAGDSNDTLFILTSAAAVFANGQAGNDTILGGGGEDTLNGGDGSDSLRGGNGADKLIGGTALDTGVDSVDYGSANVPVQVTLDAGLNDDGRDLDLITPGFQSEGDDVTFVEDVDGGSNNDFITGNASNNTLFGGSGDDTIDGAGGDDTLQGEAGGDAYTGGAGAADTVSYGSENQDVSVTIDATANDGVIDLDNNPLNGNQSEGDNVGTGIEIIIGGSGDDSLDGGGGSQTLRGAAGNDTLNGGIDVVSDILIGGSGTDTASYAGHAAGVNVTLNGVADDGTGAENDDVRSDIENILGSSNADTLVGNAGVNRISGGAGNDTALNGGGGNDTLVGDAGNDNLNGGGGVDTVSYVSAAGPVTVTLDGVGGDGEAAESDNIGLDVENVIGGSFADSLSGNASANRLSGGLGGDTLNGLGGSDNLVGGDGGDTLNGGTENDILNGGAGADAMNGGGGNADSVSYSTRTRDVRINVNDGAANDGELDTDPVTVGLQPEGDNVGGDVEQLTGGKGDDTLVGDAGNDTLNGGNGDDNLNGLQGNDVLSGGSGNDTILGHAGKDTLSGATGNDDLDSDTSDSSADSDTCGDGVDTLNRDSLDHVSANCEILS
jgi:Ca2+-binding RTX toxin-like protein